MISPASVGGRLLSHHPVVQALGGDFTSLALSMSQRTVLLGHNPWFATHPDAQARSLGNMLLDRFLGGSGRLDLVGPSNLLVLLAGDLLDFVRKRE
jgi:hypothetical protein